MGAGCSSGSTDPNDGTSGSPGFGAAGASSGSAGAGPAGVAGQNVGGTSGSSLGGSAGSVEAGGTNANAGVPSVGGTNGGAGDTGGAGGGGAGTSVGGSGKWNEGTELKAFPTAEGYGRLSKGGRGGRVMIVTNLNDSGAGSLREAVDATGPRTVVFNVGGTITLKSKLEINGTEGQLTVAGQTAPGKGISIRDYKFGMTGGEDVILRFVRTRVGTVSGETMDGMGQTASNNTILDHCSISWTIDEGFSSRQAHNITLQRTLISECLNDANHAIQMAPHGYAASINGDIGSFHHNLLAHCAGRNWSMAGALKGGGGLTTIGQLDLRNNVVYNWKDRTTDGEIFRVQFVNNYYKPGPSSTKKVALVIEHYEGAVNPPEYFITGNMMPGVFGVNDVAKSYEVKETPPGDYLKKAQLWEPHVATQTAEQAYTSVLADVGCNKPELDDHDKRIIQEVKDGTYKYSGSRTGLKGLIDNEADSGGHKALPKVERPSDWDTDKDGMPGAWETAHGLNPADASDGNKTTLSKLGYTNLEMYLNELAGDFK